jgi:hypothetical protein
MGAQTSSAEYVEKLKVVLAHMFATVARQIGCSEQDGHK